MLVKLALAVLATLSAAAPCPEGVQVVENCKQSGQVAWTFDDGPYQWESDIMNKFEAKGAKATFFLNGNNYGCIYDRADQVKEMFNRGHTLGSHTWSHAHLKGKSYDYVSKELEKVETAFIKILGVKPLYFRPPYGEYDDNVLKVLSDRGYKKLFMWTHDTEDANGKGADFGRNVIGQVRDQSPKPALILSHSTQDVTHSQVVPWGLDQLTGRGYKLVSVDTCMGDEGEWPYQWVGNPGQRDGSWKC